MAIRKADRVARDLMGKVVGGKLNAGVILPREDELSAQYGVNRGVIREAIKLLEVHGLVRPKKRRGTEVLNPLTSLSPAVLKAMLVGEGGFIDRQVLSEFLELRADLDEDMSVRAAQRRKASDVEALQAWLERLPEGADPLSYNDAINEMTLLVARAAQNRIYEMMANWNLDIMSALEPVFAVARPANDAHLAGLRFLVQLITEGDGEGTGEVVRAYHAWATPRILAAAALTNGEDLPLIFSEET
jgi:DNA-binding FadR family transcriptional regulator